MNYFIKPQMLSSKIVCSGEVGATYVSNDSCDFTKTCFIVINNNKNNLSDCNILSYCQIGHGGHSKM